MTNILEKAYAKRLQVQNNTSLTHEEKAEQMHEIEKAIFTLYGEDGAVIFRNYALSQEIYNYWRLDISETDGATKDIGRVLREMGIKRFTYSERSTSTTDFIINISNYYQLKGSTRHDDDVTALEFESL